MILQPDSSAFSQIQGIETIEDGQTSGSVTLQVSTYIVSVYHENGMNKYMNNMLVYLSYSFTPNKLL